MKKTMNEPSRILMRGSHHADDHTHGPQDNSPHVAKLMGKREHHDMGGPAGSRRQMEASSLTPRYKDGGSAKHRDFGGFIKDAAQTGLNNVGNTMRTLNPIGATVYDVGKKALGYKKGGHCYDDGGMVDSDPGEATAMKRGGSSHHRSHGGRINDSFCGYSAKGEGNANTTFHGASAHGEDSVNRDFHGKPGTATNQYAPARKARKNYPAD